MPSKLHTTHPFQAAQTSLRVAFHPGYRVDLPASHPYPMGKYLLLHQLLLESGTIHSEQLMEPDEASIELLSLVHHSDYLERLANGTLSAAEQRRLGIPLTPQLWRRSRLATAGTLLAAEAALLDGLGANMAGGTHHAFPDHGEGFCVLNDVAVAIRALQHTQRITHALVVDLDVHQGNGTAAIFEDDPRVCTLSLHGAHNFPPHKQRSTWDVGLKDHTTDDDYLAALADVLPAALEHSHAELVFFIAGVDVVREDRYGRLALTDSGLRAREQMVLRTIRAGGVPLCIVLGGGYAPTTLRTAHLHCIVFEEAMAQWQRERCHSGGG